MKYESYKDSGVEWIGKVPSHWEVAAFKRKITINNGKDYKDFLDEEIYPVMGSGGCFAYCSKYMFDGEALLLGRKGTIDKPLYINGKFWAVDTMFYATPHKDLNCKFAYYLALTFPFQLYSTSTALPSMTQTDLGNNPVAFPPIVEQQAIALYLDKKCEEIDRAIDTQKKKIELLRELKQTIITNAVTKGLNTDVTMKDSGIEWIGEVPKHWEIRKIKQVINLLTDYDANGSFADIAKNCNINNGNPYAWMVRSTDLENKRYGIVDGNNYCDYETFKYLSKSSLKPNDILLAKRGDIGKSYLIPDCNDPMTLAPNTYLLITNKDIIENVYLYYYFQSKGGVENLKVLNKSTTLGALYKDDVKAMSIPVPSIEEQRLIAKHIQAEVLKIDNQISKVNHRIELLNELKQSIITEAVTGKIKVC